MTIYIENISNLLLAITTIVSWSTYKKFKNTPLKYLPVYLTFATLLELGSDAIKIMTGTTTWWYNFGINIEILFYFYVFYQFLKNKKAKYFLFFSAIIYEIYFLVNTSIIESWSHYQVFPLIFGGILIIIVVFIFLLEMFQSDKVLHTHKYLIFWVSLGLLFYNIIPLPLFVLRSVISSLDDSQLMIIQYLANIIMYLLFIYGFIWSSMKYK